MKTLFSQTFSAILASLLVLLLLMGVLFALGVRRSISDWNFYRDQRLQNVILPVLSRVYRQHGGFDEDVIEESLSRFLTQNQFVYVLDADREPVFLYARGDILDAAQYEIGDGGGLGDLPGARPPSALIQSDEVVGYLSAGSLGFTSDLANLRFLRSMLLTAVLGVVVSFVLASGAAVLFSRAVSRQASQLSEGLRRLADGARDVAFPTSAAREMHTIGESATVLQKQLLDEERLRRQWTQDIAHDLRTPVAALKAQFEAIHEGVVAPTKERLAAVYSEVERIDELVNDLRELSRIESPEMTLSPAKLNLEPFLQRLATRFRPLTQEKGQTLSVSADSVQFVADEHMLSRALSNVVLNAVQHTAASGDIHVTAAREGDTIRFDVANAGHVNEQDIPHVFDRLYRGENSRGSRGSGLGLAITKAVAEAHGGSVDMFQEGDYTHVRIRVSANLEV